MHPTVAEHSAHVTHATLSFADKRMNWPEKDKVAVYSNAATAVIFYDVKQKFLNIETNPQEAPE